MIVIVSIPILVPSFLRPRASAAVAGAVLLASIGLPASSPVGPVAAAAAEARAHGDESPGAPDLPRSTDTTRLVGKLVLQNRSSGSKAFVGLSAPVSGWNIQRLYSSSESGAAAFAGTYSLPAVGTVGPITGTGASSALCVTPASDANRALVSALPCTGSPAQLFRWQYVANKWVSGYALYPASSAYSLGGTDNDPVLELSADGITDVVVSSQLSQIQPFVLSSPPIGALLSTPTPTFSGIGHPGASISIRTDEGRLLASTSVPAGSTSWTVSSASLEPGRYTGTATQSRDGEESPARFDFTVASPAAPGASVPTPTLHPGQPVEVEATFTADAGGQRIDVYHPAGTRIIAVDDPAFSLDGAGIGGTLDVGTTSLRFTLRANDDAPIGKATGGKVTYGSGRTTIADFAADIIEAPVVPAVTIPDVSVAQGASVEVPMSFSESALGATVVVVPDGFASGTATDGFVWDASLPGFRGTVTTSDRDLVLSLTAKADAPIGAAEGRVQQLGTGLDQPWTVTIEASGVAPLVVESPMLGETITETRPVFRGTAQPGSRLEIRGAWGGLLGSVDRVADGGAWSITWNKAVRPGRYVGGTVKQFVADGSTETFVYDFTVGVSDIAPLVVTSPVAGAVITERIPVFTGTGQPGARLEIRGVSGDLLGSIDAVGASGEWSIIWNKGLLPNRYAGGTVKQFVDGFETHTFVYDFTLVQPKLEIVSPKPGETISGTRPVFTGTANPGATVQITGAWGTDLGSKVADERTGAWSITWPRDYLPARYTGGTVTETVGGKVVASTGYDFTLAR